MYSQLPLQSVASPRTTTTNASKMSAKEAKETNADAHRGFTMTMLRRFRVLFGLAQSGWVSWDTLLLLVLLMASVGNQFIVYYVGKLPSQYYTALLRNDRPRFMHLLWVTGLLTMSEALAMSALSYLGALLALRWRDRLTTQLQQSYTRDRVFHNVSQLKKDIDNPDQRITQDVDKFTTCLGTIMSKMLVIPFLIGYYTYKIAHVLGWLGPGLILGYFVIGSVFSKLLMSPVSRLVFGQERYEGNFRFAHLQLRTHAESIAFLRGGAYERHLLQTRLDAALGNQRSLIKRQFWLHYSTLLFDYVGAFVSYIIVGVAVFSGSFDHVKDPTHLAALISLSTFMAMMLISAFTSLIDLASSVAQLSGFVHRVAELYEVVEQGGRPEVATDALGEATGALSPLVGNAFSVNDGDGPGPVVGEMEVVNRIEFVDVDCDAPSGAPLLSQVSFRVVQGADTLIMGPSGCGKSSILRLIAGLWCENDGQVIRPDPRDMFFLPQRPYLVQGSLCCQILYPDVTSLMMSESDDEGDDVEALPHASHLLSKELLTDLLHQVRLGYLLHRFDVDDDDVQWWDVLSPGECQKLAVARMLYHRPKWALMDESTSALGLDDEELVYRLVREAGITTVSVGHRTTLLSYHDQLLSYDATSETWTCERIRSNG